MSTMYSGLRISRFKEIPFCYLVGSSNGLICICTSDAKIIVDNPCTRQVKELPHDLGSLCWSICCGFGYDSSSDDYKVVVGFRIGVEYDRTFFQVFSLKSNDWKIVGEVKYRIEKDLKEISLPDDGTFFETPDTGIQAENICLGNMDECLCLFHRKLMSHKKHIWKMKKYNVKESWEMVGSSHHIELHFFLMDNSFTFEKSLRHVGKRKISRNLPPEYVIAPIFVRSLVCPHVHSSDQCARSNMHSGARVDAIEYAKLTNYFAIMLDDISYAYCDFARCSSCV
ncbi:F-box protein CPR1-like protein [Tanacetum coccineum]